MTITIHKAGLWVLFLLLPTPGRTQFNALDYERLSILHGIPATPISGIVQDHRGYLWIGTPTGLLRYNGISGKSIFYDGSLRSLPDNTVQQIECIDGKVICLTPGGTFVHHTATERDTALFLSGVTSAPAYLVNNMTDACSDGHDGLLLLSRSGFMHLDSSMQKVYEYVHRDSSESLSISASFGRVLVPMPDGQILIAGNKGIFAYDPVKKAIARLRPGMYPVVDPFIDDQSVNVYELNRFEYLFFSREQSRFLYYHTKQSLSFALPIMSGALDHLRWNTQVCAINDSSYYLLLPGKGTMPLMINKAEQQMSLGQHQPEGIRPISMFADHNHRLWLGTHNGLYKQRNLDNAIRKSVPAFDAELPGKSHVQFAISGQYLVTGTAEGLELMFYDKKTLELTKRIQFTSPEPTATSSILHFATYGQDSILVCTNGPRIWLNTQTWRYQAIDTWQKIPNAFSWYAFQSSLDGILYTIQNNSSVERYDPSKRNFIAIPLNKDVGKIVRTPTQIAEDWNGDLWLMHQGFCRYRKSAGQIDYCQVKFPGAFLNRNTVGNMVNDTAHKMLWFSLYRNGLMRYDPESKDFTRFTTKEGLPDLMISQMILIGHHIWMITPSGLASISIDDYTIRTYPYGNGAFLHYSRKALTYDLETDQIYFMHDQQIMACKPETLLNRSDDARLIIEKIECGENLWHWPEQSNLEIHGKERKFRIQLSCVAFEDSGPLQYSYRHLAGKDTTWQNIGIDGVAVIENLQPGKHDIQFRLAGTGSGLSTKAKTIRIQVYPLFWETNLFRGLLTILGFAAMWLLIRWQFQRKKARLEMDRRLSALELQALRSRLNPHFIFNSLNSINRYILKEDKGKASYYLSQFAKLIRQTLDYTSEASVSLSDEINVTRLYIELESLRMAEPIQLEVQIDEALEPVNVRVPPLFIQPYVENAIWHGLAPKKTNLRLWLRVIKKPDGYSFEVEDNGIGREAAARNKKVGQHNSKGLAIAKESFEHYGQLYQMKTDIEIIDLFDDSRSPRGTCVRLNLIQ